MKYPPRVAQLLDELLGLVPEDHPDLDALAMRVNAIEAEDDPPPRPQRRVQVLVDLQADTSVDVEPLVGQLVTWLEDWNGSSSGRMTMDYDGGTVSMCVSLDENAAAGSAYVNYLAEWRELARADRD